jgi:hypothetical protein
MTDVEERLQRALRIIADDITVRGELDLVQDQLTTRTLMEPTVEPSGRQQRWPFAVAAAAALVGVVMLAALLWWRDTGTPAPATPIPTTIVDPMRIDLDAWAGPAPRDGGPFLVFDVEHVPAGWTVTSSPAGYHPVGDPDPTHYTWNASLFDGNGRRMYVIVQHPASPWPERGTPVDVAGHDGLVADDAVTWVDDDGRGFAVNSPGATAGELVDIAERFTTTTTDALTAPDTTLLPAGEPGALTRLAGRIDGVDWTLSSGDDAASGLALQLDGAGGSSQSGPRAIDGTWDVNLTGLGDHGTILYGLAPADVTVVRVVADGVIVTLPVVHDAAGVAVWAVPVPPGLAPRELELLDAAGTPVNRVRLPTFLVPVAGSISSHDRPLDGTFPVVGPDEATPTTPS